MNEQRNFIRIRHPLTVSMVMQDHEIGGITRDIGLGGLLMSCDQMTEPGTKVSCYVTVSDNPTIPPMHFEGSIVRHDNNGVAIRFVEPMLPSSREKLCQLIIKLAVDKEQAIKEIAAYRKQIIKSAAK